MKARAVSGLKPKRPLSENAARIVRVRLDELLSFVPQALDPSQERALHDMRIAAKRLRYVLELTSFCFGPYAAKATGITRELQDVIGAIHDCDVLEPQILSHLAELREHDADAIASASIAGGRETTETLAAGRRRAYAALEALAVEQRAQRKLLFARFTERWEQLERGRFRQRLLDALEQPPLAVAA